MRVLRKLPVPVSSFSPKSQWLIPATLIGPSTISSSHFQPRVTSSPSSVSPTTSPTASPAPAPPSPSPSSSRWPISLSSTPSFPPSPPPDPLSSPSPPTPPSPPASRTFVTSAPWAPPLPSSAHSPSSAPSSSAGPNPIPTLPSNFFLGWANYLAANLAIPHVVFYSSGTFAISILDYLWPRMPRCEDGDGPAALTVLSELPSSPIFLY